MKFFDKIFEPFDWHIKSLKQYDKTYKELFNLDKFANKFSNSFLKKLRIKIPPRNVRMLEYLNNGDALGLFYPYNKTIKLAKKGKYNTSFNVSKADMDNIFFHELFHAHINFKNDFQEFRPYHSNYMYRAIYKPQTKKYFPMEKENYFVKFAKEYLDNFQLNKNLLSNYSEYPLSIQIEEHLNNLFQHHMETGYLTGNKFMDREMRKFSNKIKRTGIKYNRGKLNIQYVEPIKRKTPINFPKYLLENGADLDDIISADIDYSSRTMKDTPPIYKAKVHDSRAPKVKQQLKTNTKVNNFYTKSKKALKGIFKLITAM